MIFIDNNLLRHQCQYCNTSRFFNNNIETVNPEFFPDVLSYIHLMPRMIYEYISIIPRLKLFYANSNSMEKMRYPQKLREEPWNIGIRDIWEENRMIYWQIYPMDSFFLILPNIEVFLMTNK